MDDGGASDARPACVALVPVAQPTEWTAKAHQPSSRPASTFVAHLLATAEQALQVRRITMVKLGAWRITLCVLGSLAWLAGSSADGRERRCP